MSHHKEEKPLEKMTVPELKELALTFPHDHLTKAIHDLHKDELLDFIKRAQGLAVEEHPHHHKKKIHPHVKVKAAMTKLDLKQRIAGLKEARLAARESGDFKLTDRLRRRISHLKKMTRKIA